MSATPKNLRFARVQAEERPKQTRTREQSLCNGSVRGRGRLEGGSRNRGQSTFLARVPGPGATDEVPAPVMLQEKRCVAVGANAHSMRIFLKF